jgi:hypothetical protein
MCDWRFIVTSPNIWTDPSVNKVWLESTQLPGDTHEVFLAAIGGEESQIEVSFCEAIIIAKEQKSVSLEKRAEATYAEYRRQKASGSGERRIRLPL